MNKFSLTACCLIILTACVGCYSQYSHFSNEPVEYSIEGGESFDLGDASSDDGDVGNEELVSFDE